NEAELDALDAALLRELANVPPHQAPVGQERHLAGLLRDWREDTDARGGDLDVAAEVMLRIAPRRGILMPMRRWAPIVAAAAVLLLVGQQALWAKPLHIHAPQGVLVWNGQGWESHTGEQQRRGAVRLQAAEAAVTVQGPVWEAVMQPGALIA